MVEELERKTTETYSSDLFDVNNLVLPLLLSLNVTPCNLAASLLLQQ